MNYVADIQCNECHERWPVRSRKMIRRPCPYCQSRNTSLVKTYGPISDKRQHVPMWCVDCETRQDATSWRQACDTCQCGGTRVPTYLTPHHDHTKPADVPHASAVPWTKDSVVKKIAAYDVPKNARSCAPEQGLVSTVVGGFMEGFRKGMDNK